MQETRRIRNDTVSAPERPCYRALRNFGLEHGLDLQSPKRTAHEPLDLTE
ncbi:MAG: hypothetical protein KF911_10260 [Pseudomonadales bacterium]|nr:hypothetical protein [Pseudomonadales bacterium]